MCNVGRLTLILTSCFAFRTICLFYFYKEELLIDAPYKYICGKTIVFYSNTNRKKKTHIRVDIYLTLERNKNYIFAEFDRLFLLFLIHNKTKHLQYEHT